MTHTIFTQLGAYFRRLLFPLYLFPIKLFTYTLYYTFRALGRFLISLLLIIRDMLIFPFLSLRNFLKTIIIIFSILYMGASFIVMIDYFRREYGPLEKIFCSFDAVDTLKGKVVRIVGGYSEGSGFFISENQVITNFHVIDGEVSPKIIMPDGTLVAPTKIVGDKNLDLAILTTTQSFSDLVLPLPADQILLIDEEPVLSAGYPLGTDLIGEVTVMKGKFVTYRVTSRDSAVYLQSDISVVPGMSGGPFTDNCGNVIGINAQGVAGLSLFINGQQAALAIPSFTDADVSKIKLDPAISPVEGVRAYYTYIKARDMEKGYSLLSSQYLKKTDFTEWTSRFTDILDINLVMLLPAKGEVDTVFIKFATKIWTGSEVVYKFYEGTWVTKLEDGLYKMNKSSIKEVVDPPFDWQWSSPED